MYAKSGDDRYLVVTVIMFLTTSQLSYNQPIEAKSDE